MEAAPPGIPKICIVLDRFVLAVGRTLAWLNVLLVAVIIIQVVLRYVFGLGLVYLEELQWHLFGTLIMFGMAYGVTVNAHIRLDLVHRNLSERTKEVIEILGILFLLVPMMVVLLVHGIDFVESALRVNEGSDSPLGLPFRWIIKSVIPLSMAFLAVAVFSRTIRAVAIIFRKR